MACHLGDAAHIMPPSGEGVNLAMLDALELSECFTNDDFKDLQTAIAAYEKQMRLRAEKEARDSMEMKRMDAWGRCTNQDLAVFRSAFVNSKVLSLHAAVFSYVWQYKKQPLSIMKKQINNPFILALKAYNLTVEIHHHSAFQIVLSNDNPFTSTINGQLRERIHGFLIKPQVPHFCVAEKGSLNILNIEPYSAIGLELSGMFTTNEECIVFDSPTEINTFFQTGKDTFDIYTIINALLSKLPTVTEDERVSKIVDYIKTNYFKQDITPQTFAELVFLSPSRLASLFKKQTGSSLSKYLLWTRLRQVIYLALTDKNRSLTDIAYDTGFYDLPQLNKYMYEMLGMPPKALKYNSDLIQVY